MSNFQMLSAFIRIIGCYLLVTTISKIGVLLGLLSSQTGNFSMPVFIGYVFPIAFLLLIVLAMVFTPDRVVRMTSSSKIENADESAEADQSFDPALIGVRLLGLYFIISAVPGLASIQQAFGAVISDASNFTSFFLNQAFSTLFYIIAGTWLFVGGQRIAGYIKGARTANFERTDSV